MAATQKFEVTLPRARAARQMLERTGTIKSPILRDEAATDFIHHPIEAARAGVERMVAAGSMSPMLGRAAMMSAIERGISKSRRLAHEAERAVGNLIESATHAAPAARDAARPVAMAAPQAAVCAVAAVLLMQAINYAGMRSNLQWVYNYMPAMLHNLLQPQRAWYNVLGAAKDRLGGLLGNERWLHTLQMPSWAASCTTHRYAWLGVELAIGFAIFRVLTSPRLARASKGVKIAAAVTLFACAMRSAMWGFVVLGLRSLPLGVFHYATFVALMAGAAAVTRKIDVRASRALMAANTWVAFTFAQFAAMLWMNRA